MNVLVCTKAGYSHVSKSLPLAIALQKAGHEIAWFSKAFYGMPPPSTWLPAIPLFGTAHPAPPDGKSVSFFDRSDDNMATLRNGYARSNIHGQPQVAEEITDAIRAWQPQLVLASSEILGAALAAKKCGVRLCSFSLKITRLLKNAVNPYLTDAAREATARLVASADLDVEVCEGEFFSRDLSLLSFPGALLQKVQTERAAQLATLPETMKVIPFSFSAPDSKEQSTTASELAMSPRPLVYVAFGSFMGDPSVALLRRCYDAAIGAGARSVVISCGRLASNNELLASLPPEVRLLEFAPQLELLKHTDLFLNHGGLQSVFEGMASGVPMLAFDFPIADLEQNRALMEELGAGSTVEFNGSLESLTEMMGEVLNSADRKQRCRELARAFDGVDGTAEAAALITEHFSTRV